MADERDDSGEPVGKPVSPKLEDSGLGLAADGITAVEREQQPPSRTAESAIDSDLSAPPPHINPEDGTLPDAESCQVDDTVDGNEVTDRHSSQSSTQPTTTQAKTPSPVANKDDESQKTTEAGEPKDAIETEQATGFDGEDEAQEAAQTVEHPTTGDAQHTLLPPSRPSSPGTEMGETDGDPAQPSTPLRASSWIDELDHLEPNSPISRRASWIGEFDHLRSFQTRASKPKSESTEKEEKEEEEEEPAPDPADIDDDSPSRLEWLRQREAEGIKNRGLDGIMCMVGLEKIKALFLSMKAAVEATIRRGEALHGNLINLEVTGGPGTGKWQVKQHFTAFKDDLYDWPVDDVDVHKSHYSKREIHIDDYSDHEIHEFLKRLFRKRALEAEGGVGGFFTDLFAKRIGKGREKDDGFRNVWAIRDAFTQACDRQADRLQAERVAWKKNGETGDPPDDKFLTKEDMLGKPPPDIRETSQAYKELQAMVGMTKIKKAVEELMDRAKVNYRLEMRGKKPIRSNLNRVILGPPGTGKTTVAQLLARIIVDLGLVSKKEVVSKDPSDFMSIWVGGPQENTSKILVEAQGKVLIIDDAHTLCPGEGVQKSTSKSDQYRFEILDTIVAKTSNKPGQDRAIIMVGYPDQMHDMFFKGNPGLRSRFPLEDAFEIHDYDLPGLMDIFSQKLEAEELEITEMAREVASQVLARSRDRPNFGNGRDVENLVNRARGSYRDRTAQKQEEAAKTNGAPAGTNGTKEPVPELKILTDVVEVTEEPDDLMTTNGTSPQPDDPKSPEDGSPEDQTPTVTAPTNTAPDEKLDPYEMEDRIVLEPEDFDPDWQRAAGAGANCKALFADFVGFDQVIKQFQGYQQIVAGMRLHGRDPRPNIPFTFVFKGPPGTGKTTTARKVGQIFYDMGFLASAEVVECSATDLVGQYLGHTGPQVQAIMEKALGKVLFIDEAYRLGGGATGTSGGSFEEEAVGELVDSLTKPRYMRKVVIILAGYSEDMDALMKSNRGLRGRFATEVVFPQLTAPQCLLYLGQLVGEMGIAIRDRHAPSPEEKSKVQRLLGKLGATRDWSNGRDVETLSRKIIGDVFMREGQRGRKSARLQVSTRELIGFLQEMLRERLAGELQDRE